MRPRFTVAAVAAVVAVAAPLAAPAYAVPTTSVSVAYIADTDGNKTGELWTRPADGSGTATKLFSSATSVWLPAYSPDGTKIAYLQATSTADDRQYRLYVRNSDGTGTPTLISGGDVLSPSWSADGTQLVYFRYDWPTHTWGIFRKPADGTGSATLVPTTDDYMSFEPAFSPSGRQVAVPYTDPESPSRSGIFLITLATGARVLIPGTHGGEDPVWSPDGKTLLFQRFLAECGVGLYRVPVGGGTRQVVREVPNRFLGSAEYSRDGSQLFWADTPWDCGTTTKGDVWVGNADGTGATNLTNTPTVYEHSTTVMGGTPLAADTTPPAAPVIAATGKVSALSARVSWTADDDATEFVVLRKPHGDPAPTSHTDGTLVYNGSARTALATGLTADTTYDFYVYALDAFGNVSAVSAAHPARTTPVPTVPALPTVGRATAGTSFTVKWSGTATKYDVEVGQKVRASNGTWSSAPVFAPLLTGTTDTSLTFTGTQGRSYYFRVRGWDEHGNHTEWAAPTAAAHVPVDDRWSGLAFGSGWARKASSTRYLGTYTTTITPGAAVSARAETARFVVIGDTCSSCGQVKVYVDGVLRATVDTYSATSRNRQVLYASGVFTSIKPHSIKLVAVGTRGRPRVSIDSIALQR